MSSFRVHKRLSAWLLTGAMTLSLCPGITAYAAEPGDASVDMVVADRVYGWVTEAPVKNGDGSVTVSLMPAGETESQTYTTEKVYNLTNQDLEGMDAIDEADVVVSRLGTGVFAELCLNAEGQVIDARRVLQSGLFFDTAEFGGDLTKIGSTVQHRGVEGTGIMTGEAGDMVASGWVLAKADGSITLGDGNMATELFIEQYAVDENVKVYQVENDTYASAESTFEAIPVTPADDEGLIYNTASEDRRFAVVIFDQDYTAYDADTAKVAEIYYFQNAIEDVSKYVGLVPSSNRIGSDLSTADQGSPKPSSAPFLTSSEPFVVVDGKMWSTGDNEALNYLFYATNSDGSYSLVRYDTGWSKSGYQYWKADERALQESGIDMDSRDINQVLLSHGHGDHYGTSFDLWEMIARAGNTATVYETYEDGVGYDKYGFEDTVGALPANEYAFRSTITNWYEMDQWLELGDGLACYPILTPGHTPGVASAVYQVTVGEGGMKDAHLTYDAETGERTITDYNEGDELFFVYMGGYGINGLQSPSKGYLRPAFISSLRYLESVLPYLKTTTGQQADGIYNLPQHTNQFPYLEVESMRGMYNEMYDTDYSFLHFLREGAEEVVNFAEKRASAMLYEEYDAKYQEMYDEAGGEVPYMNIDGVDVKIDATNADPADLYTVEESGPFKREEGEYVIQIDEDVEIITMHGYDPYLNKGGVEEGILTNTASQGGSAKQNFDMSKGFLFAKDGFVTDPDVWYVQIGAHVMDDYDGNVYSDTGVNAGSEFTSGPVESFHGDGWYEIIRTEGMTKEEAEALAASLEQGAYYKVTLKKTGDIVNAENVMDTFAPASDADIEQAYEAGYAKQLPTVDYIIENYPKLDDYYGQYVEGYYAYNDFAVGDTLRDAHFYIPANSVFNQPTVFIGVPSDEENPYNFLVESGWKDLADEKGLYLITMEDGGDGWNEDDISYIAQLASDVGKRPFFCTFESNFYAIAYGDAADILQKHSVDNPKTWAAIAVVGAEEGMTEEKVEELQTTDSKVPGVPKSEVQTPVWIVADSSANASNIERMVEFYRSANHSQDTAAGESEFAETVYLPMEGGDVDDEWCANVVYDEDAYSDTMISKDYAEAIYTELFEGLYRYPGDANGALRRPGEIFSRGFEYYEAEVPGGYYEDGSDVYTREWYTYAPESAQEKIAAGEDVPVVFVFHGAGGTGNEIADRSGWAKVADENGFIIVMPSGSIAITPRAINNKVFPDMRPAWNTGAATETRPSDLELVRYIYNWLLTEYKYADSIDTTRVYASGQSSGGMMSWACAAELSDIFAAAAPVSATRALESDEDAMIPIIAFIGEEDSTFPGGFGSADGKAAIDYWTERNNTVETWDEYTYMDDDSKAPDPEGPGDKNLFTNYLFSNADGVPMLRCVEVATKTHAIWPSECFTAWNEWFVHYTRDANGVLYYDGVAVEKVTEDALDEAGELQTLPATGGTVEEQKPLNDALRNENGDFEDYYQVVYSGYYDISMTYGDVADRDLRMYIPENSRYSQPTVFLMVPSGTDPYQFIIDSGWKETADKNSITLFLLMPDREKSDGVATAWGDWADEPNVMDYIAKAVDVAGQRPGIQTVSYCFYMVGYGDAADYVTEYTMKNPTKMAGSFAVGSTGAGAELIESLKETSSAEAGVMLSEVATPFGVVTEDQNANVDSIVEYFKDANQTVDTAVTEDGFTVYKPDPEAETRQPDSEPVAGVYYLESSIADCMNADFTQSLFDIFNTVRRYPGYQNTELRAYEDVYTSDNYEYYTSLTATGEYTYGGDIEEPGDGNYYNREWWLYVPDSAKERMANGEKVQVVFVFMGSNGYGDEAPQRTGWSKVADEEGIILVSPSGHVRHQGNFGNFDRNGVDVYQYCTNWNWGDGATAIIPDDLIMIQDIHDWLFTDSKYAGQLDESRVYASGQSAGGAFAHHVAKNLPDLFAASVPCSWVDNGANADTSSDVAMIVMMGQKDTTIPGALSTENAQQMFDNYIARYGDLADKEGRDSWSDFTFMQETEGGTSICTESEGTFNKYILETENGVPMFVGLEVVGLTHATVPTECQFAWDIISRFSKDPTTSILYYDGKAVDTPTNQALVDANTPTSGGGTSSGVTTYTITASAGVGGAISPSGNVSVTRNSSKTFTITANDGYEIADVLVDGKSVGAVSSYTFEKVTAKHTISATFEQSIDEGDTPLADLPYTDVSASAWYADAVAYAVDKGLMTGTSSTTFAPETTLTRAMMAQILWNLEGKPAVSGSASFTDVTAGAWYADAVNWAAANGLVSGYSAEKFGPEDSITREQLASILCRYAAFKGQNATGSADLSAFTDAGSASAWAVDSLKWAVSEGILSGKGNNRLDPTGTASRAEVAQMLMNYLK